MLPAKSQGGSFLPLVDAGDWALLRLYHSRLGFHLLITFSSPPFLFSSKETYYWI